MTLKTDSGPQHAAAIVIEPIIGEGGFYAAPPSFLKAIRELCDKHGILMIVDEVQSGFGRSGKMFAIEHSGVEPDIITVAKSMADGMPISGVVGTDTIMDSSGPNSLGGTYTGNPVARAVTLAVLKVLAEARIRSRGLALRSEEHTYELQSRGHL